MEWASIPTATMPPFAPSLWPPTPPFPPARRPAWPDDDHRPRLVMIVRDLAPKVIARLFNAFLGVPQVDTPDRAALTDNPLAPPGLR